MTRDTLIHEALSWCDRVARKVWRRMPASAGYEYEEMVSIAHLALVQAADEWQSGKKDHYALPFRAYACWRMKLAIYDAMRNGDLGGMRVLRYQGKVKQMFELRYLDDPDETLRVKVRDRFDLAVERRDHVCKLLAKAEERGARILWRTVGKDALVSDAARLEGISQARASQLRAEALAVIRAAVPL